MNRTTEVLVRCRAAGRIGVAVIVLACVSAAWIAPPTVRAQNIDRGGLPEDDPFADELNPFGGRPAPSRPTPAPAAPAPSQPALPTPPRPAIPFPEKTVPGEPAERRRPEPMTPPMAPPSPFDEEPDMRRAPARRPLPMMQEGASPAEPLVVEAESLSKSGKFEEAREKLVAAVAADPEFVPAHLGLGMVLRVLGRYEPAVEAYSKGLELEPDNSELLLRRGIAWFYMRQFGIALEDFDDAAGIAYDDARPELWRGLTLVELGRPLEAINAYAASIRRERGYMLAYLNRGLTYLRTGEPRKAEIDFDQAIRHDPRDVRAWFNRGVAQARQRKFEQAVLSFDQALEIDPDHEPSRRNRAAIAGMTRTAR